MNVVRVRRRRKYFTSIWYIYLVNIETQEIIVLTIFKKWISYGMLCMKLPWYIVNYMIKHKG